MGETVERRTVAIMVALEPRKEEEEEDEEEEGG